MWTSLFGQFTTYYFQHSLSLARGINEGESMDTIEQGVIDYTLYNGVLSGPHPRKYKKGFYPTRS